MGGGGVRRLGAGLAAGTDRVKESNSGWRTATGRGGRGRAAAEAAVDDLDAAAGGIVALEVVGSDAIEIAHKLDAAATIMCDALGRCRRRAGGAGGLWRESRAERAAALRVNGGSQEGDEALRPTDTVTGPWRIRSTRRHGFWRRTMRPRLRSAEEVEAVGVAWRSCKGLGDGVVDHVEVVVVHHRRRVSTSHA